MIRRRLVVTIVLVVSAVVVVAGLSATATLRNRHVDEADTRVWAVHRQVDHYVDDLASYDELPPYFDLYNAPLEHIVRSAVHVRLDEDGEIVWAFPTGTAADPDPLPRLDELPGPGTPVTVDAEGGDGPRYRVLVRSLNDGGLLVMGVPMGAADDNLATVSEILLVAGAVVVTVVALAVWLLVRWGLRPVDQIVATARRIGAGDLSSRAPPGPGRGEVAELRTALNTMLDRVEEAVDARAASEEQMRRFVTDASHELRTPLTSIRGYAELHRRGATEAEAVALGMARIEEEATRMARLVDDLLLLARSDQERAIERSPIDLAGVTAEAVRDLRAAHPERRVAVDVPSSPVVVDADADRMRQVLDNLLGNAVDHTDGDTGIGLRLTVAGADVRLVVRDDGPGMAPRHAARVFERFYQIDSHRRGSGLGLAIVDELVRAHEGRVHLDTAPGQGTTLTVVLPRHDRGPAVEPPPRTGAEGQATTKQRSSNAPNA